MAGPVLEPLEGRALLTQVTYHGGPLLTNVEIQPIFLGSAWATNPVLALNKNQLVGELSTLVQDPGYLNLVAQYGIGSGTVSTPLVDTSQGNPPYGPNAPPLTFDDLTLRGIIGEEIAAKEVSTPDANRLYVVFTAPGIRLVGSEPGTQSWYTSPSQPGAYSWHDSGPDPVNGNYNLVYAVMPYPGQGNNKLGGPNVPDIESLEPSLFHEVTEAMTDPVGTGWWDSTDPPAPNGPGGDEVCDFNNTTLQWDGAYLIQGIFSNSAGASVFPTNTMPAVITTGQGLAPGQPIFSPDGQYHLIMQGDGNLVEYSRAGQVMWDSETQNNPGAYAIMQGDGNFVVYSGSGRALWDSHTWGHPGSYFAFERNAFLGGYDGTLLIDAPNGATPLWSSEVAAAGADLDRGRDDLQRPVPPDHAG